MSASYRWIDRQADFDALVETLQGEPLIGLDTEFHREKTYFPHVALVQLSWGDAKDPELALIDSLAVDLAPFAAVLEAPETTVIMHAASQDLEVLLRACGTVPRDLFDTQLVAGFAGYATPSLATLVQGILGIRLPKGDRLADWLVRPLSEAQKEYAASDVAHLLTIHAWLTDRLTRNGRLTWAQDESDELLRRGTSPRDQAEAWWKLKEARQLRGQAAGVAQALGAWRERRAAVVDQPIRFVLPDLALVSIAQRPPSDVGALRKVRGLDDRHLRGGAADEILAAVREGLAADAADLRLPTAGEVDRDLRPAVTLVSAWISQLGRDLGIDATLLATRSDLVALLRGDDDARLATGWRGDVVGDAVQRLVSGRAAISFDGKGGLVLEDRA